MCIRDRERKVFNINMTNFFLQYVENRDKTLVSLYPATEIQHYPSQYFLLSAEEKWKFYQESCNILRDFNLIIAAIDSGEIFIEGYRKISRMLSILSLVTAPQERFEIAPYILRLFELVISTKLIHKVVSLLSLPDDAVLLEAARIITFLASGPRVPHIPFDSIFHPSKMTTKVLLINDRVIGKLINLLRIRSKEVREQVIVALGSIASYDKEPRDLILQLNGVEALIGLLAEPLEDSAIRKATWTLAVICGETLPKDAALKPEKIVIDILTVAVRIFTKTEDPETIANILTILKYLLVLVEIRVDNVNVWEQVVRMVTYPHSLVRCSALSAVKSIITLNEVQTQFMLESGLIAQLTELLTSQNRSVKTDACSILGLLCQKGHSWVIIG
eukprot:TRINITY_DN9985_c0_g1_i4.p1 TRINITY_DN9985_c0_g1~~TRINITY_DN9985_c0_g1_i4.p1  ORF type:complete len:389 (-),score=92.00 TRINITY_DN9985_c0_g1_i4:674-1840(-)